MDGVGRKACRLEQADDLVSAMLGAAEHQRAFDGFRAQQMRQKRRLLRLVDEGQALLDQVDGRSHWGHRNFRRIGQIAVGQLLDRFRHGGREEQGLALGRDQGNDPLQRMDEAEVEHLIGFVEHEDFELAQRQSALVNEVEQAAWRGDENVETACNRAHALAVGNAAEDDPDREAHEAPVGLGALGDLGGKLTRRSEHQHADLAGTRHVARRRQPIERRQHEGCRLAGARLGDAEQIAAGEDRRNGLKLDGRRLRIIFRGERIEQGLRQPQRHE